MGIQSGRHSSINAPAPQAPTGADAAIVSICKFPGFCNNSAPFPRATSMSQILLVPGALLPVEIAARVLDRLPVHALPPWLASPSRSSYQDAGDAIGAHWAWIDHHLCPEGAQACLARAMWQRAAQGHPTPWQTAIAGPDDASAPPTPDNPGWMALCDPVHLGVTTDGLVLSPLDDFPLSPREALDLLDAANACFADPAGPVAAQGRQLQIASRAGQWFLLGDREWDLQSPPFDTMHGARVHARHLRGTDASLLQAAMNEVQMLWHGHAVNQAREDEGRPSANGLWIHAGSRAASAPASSGALADLLYDGVTQSPLGGGQRVVWFPHLWQAWRRRDWSRWRQDLPMLISALQRHLEAQQHASATDLVLCGTQGWRTLPIDPAPRSWLQRLLARKPGEASSKTLVSLLRDA